MIFSVITSGCFVRLERHSKIYYTSYQNGLIEWSRDNWRTQIIWQQKYWRSSRYAVGDATRSQINGLDYDSKSNKLWIADYLAA